MSTNTLFTIRAVWTDENNEVQTRFSDIRENRFGNTSVSCRARNLAGAEWMPHGVASRHLARLQRKSSCGSLEMISR